MKKQNPLVNWFLNSAVGMMLTNSMQRQTTGIQRNGRVTTKCDNLPRDYPGAKLARKSCATSRYFEAFWHCW